MLLQIPMRDVVLPLDSVITVVGIADQLAVRETAVVLSVAAMLAFAGAIAELVDRHPTIEMLPLGFLLPIGVSPIVEGLDRHIPKGYIYSAMALSVMVEMLDLPASRTQGEDAVQLRQPYVPESPSAPPG